jgi:UDPglucose--hexose-1-phosphate uridylyltransferase
LTKPTANRKLVLVGRLFGCEQEEQDTDVMPEFRKDPVNGRWVIIATERAKRPAAFVMEKHPRQEGFCPFCAGNEIQTPEEVLAYRSPTSSRNAPGWWVRVVPNKFPALVAGEPVKRSGDGMYDRINGMGVHEVVIETPDHLGHIGDMDPWQVEEILWAYRDRTIEMRKDPRLEYVMIFKNHQREAGASLDHPHSQIIATPIVPKRVQEELDGAQRYYEYKERCVFCDMIAQEYKDRVRLIHESEHFIAFLPYASRFPFETWILPKRHESAFENSSSQMYADLAKALKNLLSRADRVLDNPAYNLVIHTSPVQDPTNDHYHWHIEFMPKLTKTAGFEWGTGFYINPTPPEEAARFLREADVSQPVTPAAQPVHA